MKALSTYDAHAGGQAGESRPKVINIMLFAGVMLACASLGASGMLAHFDFEEKGGAFADDTSGAGLYATLARNVKWAEGGFGGAVATGEKAAGVKVGKIPGLDGAQECTFFIRFQRRSAGFGAHQCLISADGWQNYGGLQLQFTGEALNVRTRDGRTDKENMWRVFNGAAAGRWHSVAVSFKRPQIALYADGREVAKGRWDYPMRDGGQHIGSWMNHSFGGFIDDYRIYRRALSAREIAEIADDSRYAELEGYQDDGTGGVAGVRVFAQSSSSAVELRNPKGALTIDSLGCVSSLRDAVTSRELAAERCEFVLADIAGEGWMRPRKAEKRGADVLAFVFPGNAGEVELKVEPFDGGWKFTVVKCSLRALKSLEFCRLRPDAAAKWKGSFVNGWSDERSAVVVRSGDIKAEHTWNSHLAVKTVKEFPALGRSALVAVGPREGFREQLKAMTVAAGVPRSNSGGAWSMDSEVSRWSYVFAPIEKGDVDYWIEFVKRGGFSNIHINSGWTSILGEYEVSRWMFPGGLDEMAAACDRIHAAGLKCGIHTLTACIGLRSSWIRPVCSSNLVFDARYTLAVPLTEESTEIVVNEIPVDSHSTVYTYSSNGNFLWCNGEVIQYSGIRRRKPYAFTGIRRGALGTKKTACAPAGSVIGYLHQRYNAFYPDPDGPLAEKVAAQLGKVYNTCRLDEFYFDGSEGMGTRYGIDAMRHKIFSKLGAHDGRSPSVEASCPGANNWWFQTRTATTDHGVYGVKRFHDWHIDWGVRQGRLCNFLEPQMGWWQPRLDCPLARGHFPDEMEYFAGKNAGHDAAMSIQGVGMRPLATGIRRQLAILGWYEYPRLAGAFAPEVIGHLAGGGTEGRLRQEDDGRWKFTKVTSFVNRARNAWERRWNVVSDRAADAALRVEALYAAKRNEGAVPLFGADDFKNFAVRSAKGVSAELERGVAGRSGAKALRLSAENTGAEKNASWAEAKLRFDFPGRNTGGKNIAFGTWIKGDGSGALLNLQITTGREFGSGISDHYIRLDFTGWKYVEFFLRERDSARFPHYRWPYGGGYAPIYRNTINTAHIGTFAFYLNDIAGGSRAVVEIGEVEALEMVPARLDDAAVIVGGARHDVPFALKSGEYAELDDMRWTKFSARGDKLECVPAGGTVSLKAGGNEVEFVSGGCAEVTFFALGEKRDAFAEKLSPEMKARMRFEALAPFEWNPARGLAAPKTLPVRPGEKAKWSFEIVGPCGNPAFTFKTLFGMKRNVYTVPASAAEGESIVCRDGVNYQVVKCRDGEVVREGRLDRPLPVLRGSYPFEFSAEIPEDGMCVVDILKEYF